MVDYLYDGTFEGFLTCVFAHYYEEKANGVFPARHYQPNLLFEAREIVTDETKARRAYRGIEGRISAADLARVYRVFLSNVPGKETSLLRYIVMGFKIGPKIRLLHGEPTVFAVQTIENKVTLEVHRFLGLIRFTSLKGDVLYSVIEPDHDICELLAGHFCDRLKNDPFIIHDKSRSKAVIGAGGDFFISAFTLQDLPPLAAEENEYRRLWKAFFESIAIKERTNPRCQKNFMPVRYWKNLTEMV